jgi:transposase
MTRTALDDRTTKSSSTLYLAMELSKSAWKLAFSTDGQKVRTVAVHGGSVPSVAKQVAAMKAKLGLPATARVLSCYEAGRDGFWIHRQLAALGFENLVVDPASIEVDRREKRAKTDRIDATKLVQQLVRHDERGDRMRVVRVPTPEQEDARRPLRELERLKKERTQHTTRIRALLALHGILDTKLGRGFELLVDHLCGADGKPLPVLLRAELRREAERLEVVRKQVSALERSRSSELKNGAGIATKIASKLMELKAIGPNAATIFALEMFAWREFKNGRQVGAGAGLTPTPYDSGGSQHEQGINKAGNRRVRAIAIEIAWRWLAHQPCSRLSRWYMERFAGGSGRTRRIGIVALARKLLVALWRFVDQDVVPEGAVMKA